MRAWCRKKLTSARNSNNYSNKEEEEEDEQHARTIKDSPKGKAKSFEQHLIRKSRKNSSGSHSDGVTHSRPHPLPPPSFSSLLAHASAAPSASVSSVSSSGSSDDSPNLGFTTPCRYQDPANTTSNGSVKPDLQKQQLIVDSRHQVSASPFSDQSKLPELLISPGTEFQSNGYNRTASPEIEFNTRSRSPGPTSRPHSLLSSPVHIRLSGFNPESSAERQGNGKLLGHPLPLPPGSPSASSSHTFKTNGIRENGYNLHSKWKKGKLLGRGTFGHVYVGFNSSVSGQFCAIKEVRVIIDDQNSKESLKQLNQEIMLLSQLSHPNIVQYYGSELAEETLSVYLEYVSGGSIHKLLQEYGPFEEPVIQSYTGQILSGLAYLHERDTVHRDIKGANILVDPNGGIKLADFGMAKHTTSCTNMLSFKGSPYWMAPEVIMNTNGYNLAVDIWSLGCTIIEMATSKPPWSQHEGVAAIFKIGNSKDMPDIPDHISEAGKNFLKLCLQRDPSARPTAVELLEHPFVRDRTVAEVAKIKLSKTLHPFSANVSQSPNSVEWQSHRLLNARSYDGDYRTKQKVRFPPAFMDSSHRVRAKMPMSLPVSPRSTPRVSGPADRSWVLSPPHPTYSLGMTGYKSHPVSPRRVYQNGNNPDPWADVPQRRSQTPDGSPRARHSRNAYL